FRFLFIASIMLSACSQQKVESPPVPAVAWWIQDEPILMDAFKWNVETKIKTWMIEGDITEEEFARILDFTIEELAQERVLRREAARLNLEIVLPEIEQTDQKKDYPEGFASLKKSDYNWSERISRKMELMIISRKIAEKLMGNIKIEPDKVRLFYEENMDRYTEPELFELRVIRLYNPDLAEDIYKKLNSGWKFDTLAVNYSNLRGDGARGEVFKKQLGEFPREFEMELAALKPGRISKVLCSAEGYYIYKMVKKYPSVVLPFEEVNNGLQEELRFREEARIFQEWLEKEVKKMTIRLGTPLPFPTLK
ncbi:peptidyl-prolyl cis-trans isomerase, partial [bacterium]|nr:peptidyl-prolyl cis-trans isomerase [bacterium]